MATRRELIFDVKIILEGANITDESMFDEDYIGFKIDQKRSKEIRDTFKRNPVIEPIWIQDYGVFNLTQVDKSEDRSIVTKCKISKAVLPPVVSITDNMSNSPDLGVHSIRSVTGNDEFSYMPPTKLSLITEDSFYSKLKYYTRIGNSYYLTKGTEKARGLLILENPLDGFVLDNTLKVSGDLVSGNIYEVVSGTITYNALNYAKGQTFTATSVKTFTGSGTVFLQNQKRRMTNDDQYPMSSTMAEVVLMKLFTQDFGIQEKRVMDIKNDSQNQLAENNGQGPN